LISHYIILSKDTCNTLLRKNRPGLGSFSHNHEQPYITSVQNKFHRRFQNRRIKFKFYGSSAPRCGRHDSLPYKKRALPNIRQSPFLYFFINSETDLTSYRPFRPYHPYRQEACPFRRRHHRHRRPFQAYQRSWLLW